MPENLIQTGGAGAGGAIFGAIMTFFGFKRRIEKLEDSVVYSDTCEARIKRIEDKMETHTEALKYLSGKIDKVLSNR